MQRFTDMSINRKLTVLILGTCTAVLLLTALAMIGAETVTSRRFLVDALSIRADLLARNSTAPLAFHRSEDAEELTKTLSALVADSHIIVAGIYDKHDNIFAQYVRKGAAVDLPAHSPAWGEQFGSGWLAVTRPVILDGNRLGTIYVRSDLGRLYEQIEMHCIVILGILLCAIILTLAVSPRLRQPIAEPVLALAELARRIARDNDYSARAVKHGNDEIGVLAASFNQMLGEIESTHSSLQIAKETAEAANRAKDQFFAVLSHELRTPLTPVLLTISLLEESGNLPPEIQEDIQTIRRHVELEARLIDDMLDLTRITRGKLQLHFEVADLHTIINDAIQISLADRTSDVSISLEAEEHYVRADSGRLTQVFWNLLSNARKFTPAGSMIRIHSSNPAPGKIRIEVADSGVGIDPKLLPRIFDAFQQADSTFIRQFGGLGLGLTIAKALVEAHGGAISAQSQGAGTGATFTIELTTVPAPAPRSILPSVLPPEPGQGKPGRLRVLLVEDHPMTLKLMIKLLRQFGYEVTGAMNMKDALAIAAAQPLDLVVSDLGLPDGTGYELMQQLRDQYGLRGISVSGFGMEHDIARSAEAGFHQHLTKPIDLPKLQAAIQATITKPPANAAGRETL